MELGPLRLTPPSVYARCPAWFVNVLGKVSGRDLRRTRPPTIPGEVSLDLACHRPWPKTLRTNHRVRHSPRTALRVRTMSGLVCQRLGEGKREGPSQDPTANHPGGGLSGPRLPPSMAEDVATAQCMHSPRGYFWRLSRRTTPLKPPGVSFTVARSPSPGSC